jgi:hypothetical protein
VGHDNGTPIDALLMPPDAGGVVGYNAAMDGFNYKHFRVSVTQVLQRLASYSRQDDMPGLAMQSALIQANLPGLLESHSIPFLDPAIQPRLWMGNRVTTPAHFDSSHNLAVVVCGRRRFTLFPPDQVKNLYVGPLDFAPTAAAISLAPLDAVPDERYPRMQDALADAQVARTGTRRCDLHPAGVVAPRRVTRTAQRAGELLVAPGSVPGPRRRTGLDALLHCILAFKSLPRAERDAWKVLLDHYVFSDEDPAAHIPSSRRGVLGPLTPETVARLKQLMAK